MGVILQTKTNFSELANLTVLNLAILGPEIKFYHESFSWISHSRKFHEMALTYHVPFLHVLLLKKTFKKNN
jgi:hypothetical protein